MNKKWLKITLGILCAIFLLIFGINLTLKLTSKDDKPDASTLSVKPKEENFRLSYETISASMFEKKHKYQKLNFVDQGHHKTMVRIHGLPESEKYILRWERPLLADKNYECECPRGALFRLQHFLEIDDPVMVMSSCGFMPGEKVTWTLESLDGKFKSESLTFIPHPIVQEIPCGGAKVKMELSELKPAFYEMTLEGMKVSEKLEFKSFSSGEAIDKNFSYKKDCAILISPDVIGKSGGFCNLTLTRQNGDRFKLSIPWGEEVFKHLKGDIDPITLEFSIIKEREGLLAVDL